MKTCSAPPAIGSAPAHRCSPIITQSSCPSSTAHRIPKLRQLFRLAVFILVRPVVIASMNNTAQSSNSMASNEIQVHTIGFTKKSAETFFDGLRQMGVKRVVDVRLSNVSQLAGFSKKDDLPYFLKNLAGIDYIHEPKLAPTQEILDAYREGKDWAVYEEQFLALMERRQIESVLPPELLDGGCLLCSEATPHNCHRRLVAEYLGRKWGCVRVNHIV